MEVAQILHLTVSRMRKREASLAPSSAGAARCPLPVAEAPELAEKLISPKYRPTGLCSARCQVTGTGGQPVTRLLREWEGREGAGGPGPPGRRLASAGPSLVERSCALHGGDPRRFPGVAIAPSEWLRPLDCSARLRDARAPMLQKTTAEKTGSFQRRWPLTPPATLRTPVP